MGQHGAARLRGPACVSMRVKEMNTQISSIAFRATFGIVAGYGHDIDDAGDSAAIVAHAWREALEAEFASSGILVGGVVSAGRVVYPADFGCQEDGEQVATVCGDSNPKFVGDGNDISLADFREAVIRIAGKVKGALQQERVQLTFFENSGFVYYEPEQDGGQQRFGDC